MLPRMDSMARSGRSLRSCAERRCELVPTFAPLGSAAKRGADDGIARVFPRRHGGEHEARGQLRGEVLEAVHRDIGAAVEQRLFDLLREDALAADESERRVGDAVAGGLHDFDARGPARFGQPGFHPSGLPEGELRSAGGNG